MTHTVLPPQDLDEQVRQVQRRTVRYWFDDGLAELVIGGFFVVIGLYLAALGTIPLQGYSAMLFGILLPALVIGFSLAGRRLIRKAKEGLVYPRTGYVSYARPSARRRWLTPVSAVITSALLVALVRRAPSLESWIPALQGLLVAGLVFLMNRSARLGRLSFLAGVSALTGLLLALRGGSSEATGAIFFTVVGIVMTMGGALALRRYLRQAPPPEGA
jgi:hypothetical protein